jgi:hypothetical protein
MLSLYIETANDAFAEDKRYEVARILEETAAKIDEGHDRFPLYDVNGNKVGFAGLNVSDRMIDTDAAAVVLSFETDNAAFEDNGEAWETARILRDAADKVREGDLNFSLRDMNGNCVGFIGEKKEHVAAHDMDPEGIPMHGDDNEPDDDSPTP